VLPATPRDGTPAPPTFGISPINQFFIPMGNADRDDQPIGSSAMQTLYRFLNDETGATAIEYGLIAALVSVVIITAVATLGDRLTDTFTSISDCLEDPAGCQ
jgi:pilus assembly protein Flp/PilA